MNVWVLPIVLCIAGLMILPAGAVLSQQAGHTTMAGSSVSASVTARASGHAPAAPTGLSGLSGPTLPTLSSERAPTVKGLPALSAPSSSLPSSSLSPPSPKLGTTNLSAALARINETFARVPGSAAEATTARLIAEGVVPPEAAYFPNLHLLSQPASSPVVPSYSMSPAPMGIADLGLGASGPYAVYTPDVLGSVSLTSYNATAGSLYEDTGAYYWDGLSPTTEVTPWQSGLQLNTVVTNVSYPGSNAGSFWTQNVVDFSSDKLQFIDNVWNFTGPNASMNASTLYAYGGTWVVGDYYYDVGPSFPLAFPLTLDLYNNASNVNGRTTVTFGYRLTEGVNVYTGIYDTVVFNSMPTVAVPLLTPDYLVDGNHPAYYEGPYQGPLYDAELVFSGPGGGSNAVINALSGSMNLDYRLGASWSAAPSAYDYGADTGETAIGVATYWEGTTAYESQGPSILYGLWNTPGAVPSGEFSLTVYSNPIYAFAFVGLNGTSAANLSYMPTGANGVGQTYLPPTLSYNLSFLADGFDPVGPATLGPAYTQPSTGVGVEAFPAANPSDLYTPIYLNGAAQAQSFAKNVTGWTSGAYVFSDLTVNVSLPFNHLNDWGFPEFGLFWSYNASNEIVVNDLVQGPDSLGGLCSGAGVPATCYLAEAPPGYQNLPDYGSAIADWAGSVDDFFENLLLVGSVAPIGVEVGGVVSLWDTSDAIAYQIESVDGSYGVWAANSPALFDLDTFAFDAVGLTLLDSPNVDDYNSYAELEAADVLDEGGAHAFVYNATAFYYAEGFLGLAANDSEVDIVTADDHSTAVDLELSSNTVTLDMDVNDSSYGIVGEDLTYTTVLSAIITLGSEGTDLAYANYTELVDFYANDSWGAYLVDSYEPEIIGLVAVSDSYGAILEFGANLTAVDISAWDSSTGLYLADFGASDIADVYANFSAGVEIWGTEYTGPGQAIDIESVVATDLAAGVYAVGTSQLNVLDVSVNSTNPADGVEAIDSDSVNVTNVTVNGPATGVFLESEIYANVTNVTATGGAIGLDAVYVDYVSATNLLASSSVLTEVSEGASVAYADDVHVTNASASGYSYGVSLYEVGYSTVTKLAVSLGATGAELFDCGDDTVTDVTVTTGSFLTTESVGVNVNATDYSTISTVTASGYAIGVNVSEAGYDLVTDVSVTNGAVGVLINASYGVGVYNVLSTTVDTVGVAILDSSEVFVENVTALSAEGTIAFNSEYLWVYETTAKFADSFGVTLQNCSFVWVNNTTANGSQYGVGALVSHDVAVTNTTVAGTDSVGVIFEGTNDSWVNDSAASGTAVAVGIVQAQTDAVTDTSASGANAIGVVLEFTDPCWVNATTVTGGALAVVLAQTVSAHVTGVTATGTGPVGSPWVHGTLLNTPTAAVVLVGTSDTTLANVLVTYYPAALYDNDSTNLFVQALSAEHGPYGVLLNGTRYALLTDVTADWDGAGLVLNAGADSNVITTSHFENDTGYGVDLASGVTNLVYDNDFVDDNGANATYNATHVQAFSVSAANAFNNSAEVGNYWADWHTYLAGVLAPYYVSSGAWDYHPLGAPEGMVAVTFASGGLPPGADWSVKVGASTLSTVGGSLVFDEFPGTYAFTVTAPSGWTVTPASGSVVVSTGPLNVPLTFTPVPLKYTVWVNETGLAPSTSWSAVFNGVQLTTTGTSLVFSVTAGTYAYQIGSVTGYSASPSSGTATVGGNYTVLVTFTSTVVPPPVKYTVWVNETGLAPSTSWSAIFNGVSESTTGTSLSFTVTAGTYSYQIGTVSGYVASPSSGSVTVSGEFELLVTYSSTVVPPPTKYTVWVNETGLAPSTGWSAIFNGVSESTTGTSLAFSVPAGTYSYQVGSVTGYSASPSSGSVTIGGNFEVLVTYTSTVAPPPAKYTVWINESGLSAGTSWSAIFDGVQETTTGTSLSFTVTAGTYDYQIGTVAGFTASSTGGSATVGGNYAIGVTFTTTSVPAAPSSVPTSTFNTDWAIALGLAALGLIVALIALLRRPPTWSPGPAAAWQEPAPQEGEGPGAQPEEKGH